MNRKQILEEAVKTICEDRQKQYGEPLVNFQTIANYWNVYLQNDEPEFLLSAHDVGIMLALMKIARMAGGQVKVDSYIDLAGYAACAGEIAAKGGE